MAKREDERLAAASEALRREWGTYPKPSHSWGMGYFARDRAGKGNHMATALAKEDASVWPDVDAVEYKRGWDAKPGKGAEYNALHVLRTVKNVDRFLKESK